MSDIKRKMGAAAKGTKELQAKAKQLAAEKKHLQKQLDDALESIERYRKANFRIPTGKAKKTDGDFCRFIIPDTHGCFANAPAVSAVLGDMELLKPHEEVWLGDHLDCAGWLAAHHPFKTVQEARYTFEEDETAVNEVLTRAAEANPNAKRHMLEGNHEERIEAWCVEQTSNPTDAAWLARRFSPQTVMSLESRKIQYYRRTEKHSKLRVRGVLKLGSCHFCHGISHAKNAADIHLQRLKVNVVFGHTHRPQQASSANTQHGLSAWCPGCLCEFEPMWKHSVPTEWEHGYAIQLVRKNGDFLHLPIPIINGQSYLAPLIQRVA